MGKATRSLSGASQKKYVRELVGSIDGITPDVAAALISACEREIAQVRVRLPIPERGKASKPSQKKATAEPARAEPATAAGTAPATADFDPFAFSVVVVVTKEGRDGLAKKLASIGPADLKALAKAQHVALPEGNLSADGLRAAIIDGALQRIANRKAAAS